MDLIKQNKFISWVIAILVALNLLTVTMIWMQSGKRNPAPPKDADNSSATSAAMLQHELQLTADQANRYESLWKKHQEEIKQINDLKDNLKLRMAGAIFDSGPDKQMVDSIAMGIGSLEARMEMLRYENFRGLMQICNSDQKAILRPILLEVLRRRGPAGKPESSPGPPAAKPIERKEKAEGPRPPREDGRPAPPTVEEKVRRYAEKLSLSPDQIKKVEVLLRSSRTTEEAFKSQNKSGPEAFEKEKKRINREEDERLLQILNPEQKQEFDKMKRNREDKGRPTPPEMNRK
ncbi:MAG: periplasmic heavy metal sensor [Ignavibacteriales bacterium]|nr:periplasmic heavy metal sensor [Ignavibacteriales bacterium]